METDAVSTNTSVDDNKADGENPSRDLIADGITGSLKPLVDKLEEKVEATKRSQAALDKELDDISRDLEAIATISDPPDLHLDEHVKRLANARRRVMVVNNILHNVQERLSRLHQNIVKEAARRKALTEPSPVTTPTAPHPAPPGQAPES